MQSVCIRIIFLFRVNLMCIFQNRVLNESRREKNERLQREIADMQPSVPPSDIVDDDNDNDEDLLLPSESPQQSMSIN